MRLQEHEDTSTAIKRKGRGRSIKVRLTFFLEGWTAIEAQKDDETVKIESKDECVFFSSLFLYFKGFFIFLLIVNM